MKNRTRNTVLYRAAIGAVAVLSLAITGCGATTTDGGAAGGGEAKSVEKGFTVGLLLPESKTARYEKFDKPYFEEALAKACEKCDISYQNADQDTSKQQSQAEAMLTEGVDVLVLDAVDTQAAGSIVKQAKSQDVPVVAYDRLAQGGVDYYVSFDNKTVGKVQGESLIEALEKDKVKDPEIVMINGSPTDPNAADFKSGANEVLKGQVKIGAKFDTPDWSPDKAQNEMEQAITSVGVDKIDGVYSANDGMASGVIAALKSAGVDEMPPITGQDAELAGIQRIISGEQYMTVYKAIKPEAKIAADMAVAAATGEEYKGEGDNAVAEVEDPDGAKVKSVLLDPVAVTKDNIEDTVISDGFYTVEEICTGDYADQGFCKEATSDK